MLFGHSTALLVSLFESCSIYISMIQDSFWEKQALEAAWSYIYWKIPCT